MAKSKADFFQANMGTHESTTWTFFFCELLNVGAVVLCIWLNDKFLKGKFLLYGYDAVNYLTASEDKQENMTDPMCYTFPTMVSLHGTPVHNMSRNPLNIFRSNVNG